jgi:hypothetical protein
VALRIVEERKKARKSHSWWSLWMHPAAPGEPRPSQQRSWFRHYRLQGLGLRPEHAAGGDVGGRQGGSGGQWAEKTEKSPGRRRPLNEQADHARARPSWQRLPFPTVRRWLRWRLERRQRQLVAAKDRLATSVRRALGAFDDGLAGTSDAEMWQAIEATSAAPSIFPRARLGGLALADGGLVANNPTLVALREAAALWPSRRVGVVVSLGTGTSRPQSTSTPSAVRARRARSCGPYRSPRSPCCACPLHSRCACRPIYACLSPRGGCCPPCVGSAVLIENLAALPCSNAGCRCARLPILRLWRRSPQSPPILGSTRTFRPNNSGCAYSFGMEQPFPSQPRAVASGCTIERPSSPQTQAVAALVPGASPVSVSIRPSLPTCFGCSAQIGDSPAFSFPNAGGSGARPRRFIFPDRAAPAFPEISGCSGTNKARAVWD